MDLTLQMVRIDLTEDVAECTMQSFTTHFRKSAEWYMQSRKDQWRPQVSIYGTPIPRTKLFSTNTNGFLIQQKKVLPLYKYSI